MNTLQDKPVVHLHPHQDFIPTEFGGDVVEIVNGPTVVHLPNLPPALDSQRRPWCVYVKNLGPTSVTIVGKSQFSVEVNVDRIVQIKSKGSEYISVR
jgi:hypothetical protein